MHAWRLQGLGFLGQVRARLAGLQVAEDEEVVADLLHLRSARGTISDGYGKQGVQASHQLAVYLTQTSCVFLHIVCTPSSPASAHRYRPSHETQRPFHSDVRTTLR